MKLFYLTNIIKMIQKTLNLMIGQSDYEAYLQHFNLKHPNETPLTEKEFFQENLMRRYRKGSSRCC